MIGMVIEAAQEVRKHPTGLKIAASLGAAVIGGTFLAASGWVENNFSTKTEVSMSVDGADIVAAYPIAPKECHAGYDAEIRGSKASIKLTYMLAGKEIPTGISASDNYTDVMSNQLCNSTEPGKKKVSYNPDTKKTTVSYSNDAFTVLTFPKNPINPNSFAPPVDGPAMIELDVFSKVLAHFPSITSKLKQNDIGVAIVNGPSSVHNVLRGAASEQAAKISSEACGPKALQLLKGTYTSEAQKETLNQMHDDPRFVGLPLPKASDITINFPASPKITDQYASIRPEQQRKYDEIGIKLTGIDPATVDCGNKVGADQPS